MLSGGIKMSVQSNKDTPFIQADVNKEIVDDCDEKGEIQKFDKASNEEIMPKDKLIAIDDYEDSFVEPNFETNVNIPKNQKSPRTLNLSTVVLIIILTATLVLLAVFIILYFSSGKNGNDTNNIAENSTIQATLESPTQDLSATSSEISINDLECLKNIGKTLSTLEVENPNMVINPKTPSLFNGIAQLLGDYNGDFAYYFYTSNGLPSLRDIEYGGYGKKMICAGVYTTIGDLFTNTKENTKAQDFFEAINIDDYTYTSNNILEPGLVQFEYKGYLIVIDYSSEISNDTVTYGTKAQEVKDIPPQYIRNSYSVFVIDKSVNNTSVIEDWNNSQNIEDDDYLIDDEDDYKRYSDTDNSYESNSKTYSSNSEKVNNSNNQSVDSSDNNNSSTSKSTPSYNNSTASKPENTSEKLTKTVNGFTFKYQMSYESAGKSVKLSKFDVQYVKDKYGFEYYQITVDGEVTGSTVSLRYIQTDKDGFIIDDGTNNSPTFGITLQGKFKGKQWKINPYCNNNFKYTSDIACYEIVAK